MPSSPTPPPSSLAHSQQRRFQVPAAYPQLPRHHASCPPEVVRPRQQQPHLSRGQPCSTERPALPSLASQCPPITWCVERRGIVDKGLVYRFVNPMSHVFRPGAARPARRHLRSKRRRSTTALSECRGGMCSRMCSSASSATSKRQAILRELLRPPVLLAPHHLPPRLN